MSQVADSDGVRRTRDAAATRSALLSAATELFAERGFDGTSVEQIAQRAAINKAMISYHFGGKAGLYRAIIEVTIGAAAERLSALRARDEPPARLLREVVAAVADVATRHPSFPAMMIREALSGGRHVDSELLSHFQTIFASVADLVERGVRDGSFRPVDPRYTHFSLVGSLVFFFATGPFRRRLLAEGLLPHGPPFEEKAYVSHVQELISRGLSASPEDGRRSDRTKEQPCDA